MPITVICRNCSARSTAPDAAAGKQAKCPKCGNPLTIPEPIRSSPPIPAYEVVEDESGGLSSPMPPSSSFQNPPRLPQAQPIKPQDARFSLNKRGRSEKTKKPYIGDGVSRKHMMRIKEFLRKGERVLAIVSGHLVSKEDSFMNHYLIVTDARVHLWARGVFANSTQSFLYKQITNVEIDDSIRFIHLFRSSNCLVLTVGVEIFRFQFKHQYDGKPVRDLVLEMISEVEPLKGNVDADPTEQIERLAKLFQQGMITATEYEESKRKLLAAL